MTDTEEPTPAPQHTRRLTPAGLADAERLWSVPDRPTRDAWLRAARAAELQERVTIAERRAAGAGERMADAEREVARVLAGAGVTRHPLYAPG